MKNVNNKSKPENVSVKNQQQRPEIRDNLDSREGEEQLDKGDDSTHNVKDVKSKKKK